MAIREKLELSERRATGLALAHRSTTRYPPGRREDPRIRRRLLELAALRLRHGCDLLRLQLRREGFGVNRKRILRLYRLGLRRMETEERK